MNISAYSPVDQFALVAGLIVCVVGLLLLAAPHIVRAVPRPRRYHGRHRGSVRLLVRVVAS